MSATRFVYFISAALCLKTLVGCAVLPASVEYTVYSLAHSMVSPPSNVRSVNSSLRITTPHASSQMLGSTRIAVVPEKNRLSQYKNARWSDPVPVLIRNLLLDAFHMDGRIKALSDERTFLSSDLELDSDLRAFQNEYHHNAVKVVVRLNVRLIHVATQRVIAARMFEVQQSSDGEQVAQVVSAFGQASETLSKQLIDWTLEHMDKSSTT